MSVLSTDTSSVVSLKLQKKIVAMCIQELSGKGDTDKESSRPIQN